MSYRNWQAGEKYLDEAATVMPPDLFAVVMEYFTAAKALHADTSGADIDSYRRAEINLRSAAMEHDEVRIAQAKLNMLLESQD